MDITAGSRHELVCRACGAPLDNTEYLEPPSAKAVTPNPVPVPAFSRPARVETEKSSRKSGSTYRTEKKRRKRKKKRGLVYWIKEAIDEIEDLFD